MQVTRSQAGEWKGVCANVREMHRFLQEQNYLCSPSASWKEALRDDSLRQGVRR